MSDGALDREDAGYASASDAEMTRMAAMIGEGLNAGSLGVGYGIQYYPGATREEIERVFPRLLIPYCL